MRTYWQKKGKERKEGKEKQEKLERNGGKKKVKERTDGCWKERRREERRSRERRNRRQRVEKVKRKGEGRRQGNQGREDRSLNSMNYDHQSWKYLDQNDQSAKKYKTFLKSYVTLWDRERKFIGELCHNLLCLHIKASFEASTSKVLNW